jgi:hypothetical protein
MANQQGNNDDGRRVCNAVTAVSGYPAWFRLSLPTFRREVWVPNRSSIADDLGIFVVSEPVVRQRQVQVVSFPALLSRSPN